MIEVRGPVVLADDLWDELVLATDGALTACYQCGTCTAVCAWQEVGGEPVSVRRMLRAAQLGVRSSNGHGPGLADLWRCTTCALCETRCPRQVAIVDSVVALRGVAFAAREAPAALEQKLWAVYEDGNPWGGQRKDRAGWAAGLGLKDAREGVDVLYHVGCAASYDPRIHRVARSLARLFEAGGLDFGILGPDESCAGDVVRDVGETAYLEELAEANIAAYEATGARSIVATSPHAFHMLKHVYPRYGLTIPVRHYLEVLDELLADGRLRPERPVEAVVTYHDPCYLARHDDVCDAPRRILAAIPGLTIVEMPAARRDTLCCGGGGGHAWLESAKGERMADVRVAQAAATGAGLLATSCPNCIQCFEDASRTAPGGLSVVDVAELLARSI